VTLAAGESFWPESCADASSTPGSRPTTFEDLNLTVDGETAHGYLAYPTDAAPTTLVVIAHGCCIKTNYWSRSIAHNVYQFDDLAAMGAAVVGMDFRGNGHWNVATGARDTVAATEYAHDRWNITRTIMEGASMGGEVAGMAIAARPDLYDFWVDHFGVTDLYETFASLGTYPKVEAKAQPTNPLGSWILEETGGSASLADPDAWIRRSPVFLADQMAGLDHAYLCHGAGDSIVYPTQSVEMADALRRNGIPTTLIVVPTNADGRSHTPFVPTVNGRAIPGANTMTPEEIPAWAGHDPRSSVACSQITRQLIASGEVGDERSWLQVEDPTLAQLRGEQGLPVADEAGVSVDLPLVDPLLESLPWI
jgi:acetyl esterase/lipase